MQSLASGVGDLKKVLTNVKTRGTWGEISLGSLLEQVLTPQQYRANVKVAPRRGEIVEYAICLPGKEDGADTVYLPIDSKFPMESYIRLTEAAERGEPAEVDTASRQLEASIKENARSIRDKYIVPPHTTDFAIMFLPTEGLYAEVTRRAELCTVLQRDYRVTIMGPTTLGAFLNSLQMGFRTLAIQKRSGEVWKMLGAIKVDFGRFGVALEATQKKLSRRPTIWAKPPNGPKSSRTSCEAWRSCRKPRRRISWASRSPCDGGELPSGCRTPESPGLG